MSTDDPSNRSRTPRLRRGCKLLKQHYPKSTVREHHPGCIECILPNGESIALYEDYVYYRPNLWIRHSDERWESLEHALELLDRVRAAILRVDFMCEIKHHFPALDPHGSGPIPLDED
jgi:hypothetical protein